MDAVRAAAAVAMPVATAPKPTRIETKVLAMQNVSLQKPATPLNRCSLVVCAAAAGAGALALLLLAVAAIGDAAGFDVVSPIFWGAYALDASIVAVGGGVVGVLLGSAATAGRHVAWSVAAMVAGSLVWLVGIEWPFGMGS